MTRTAEQKLWVCVLRQVANDALTYKGWGKNEIFGADRAYNWAKTKDARLVCEYAGVDYDAVLTGFKNIKNGITTKDSIQKLLNNNNLKK